MTLKAYIIGYGLLHLVVSGWCQDAVQLTPEQQLGKQIYTQGMGSATSDILASMSGVDVPATVLPCASCHGPDGKGKPEGGITPSNLTWKSLTKPYSSGTTSQRVHAPYTRKTVLRAFTMGLDPAGNTLHASMPRYRMSQQDAAALVAYLTALGEEAETGVSDTLVRVGMHHTSDHPAHQAAFAVTQAYFSEINAGGGVFGRQLRVQPVTDLTAAADEVFSLLGGQYKDANTVFAGWAAGQQVPVIGAVADRRHIRFQDNHYLFYLYPGLIDQIESLVQQAGAKTLVVSTRRDWLEIAQASNAQVSTLLIDDPAPDLADLIATCQQAGREVIVPLLSPTQTHRLILAADRRAYYPDLWLIGSLAPPDLFELPVAFDEKIQLTYPTWMSHQAQDGIQEYLTLQAKYQLDPRFRQTQLTALAAAKLLVEGLKRTGRNLDRIQLIDQLQRLYQFDTGLVPPLSYTQNNRLGSTRVYLARVGLRAQTLTLSRILE